MADTKISGLAAVTDVQTTDEFVLARAGATKKISGADLATEIGGGGGGGGGDLTAYLPDLPRTTPNALDDEFTTGSLDSKWSWVNQGGATATFPWARGLLLTAPANASQSARVLEQPITGTFDVRIKMTWKSTLDNYRIFGIMARNSGSGKGLSCEVFDSSGSHVLGMRPYNSMTSLSSIISSYGPASASDTFYYRMVNDATTVRMSVSYDGIYFFEIGNSQALATHISSIDRIGIFVDNENGGSAMPVHFLWFRRYA